MSQAIGWQSALPDILAAAHATRTAAPFNEPARAREVTERIAAAKKFPLWPAVAAVIAFVLPSGWVWAAALLILFGALIYRAMRRGAALAAELEDETRRLRASYRKQTEWLSTVLAGANWGYADALRTLLARWHEHRPESLSSFALELQGGAEPGWLLAGEGMARDDVPGQTPRIGRGGRTFFDKRKATEIDEDLAELNAAGVLSALMALFNGTTAQHVAVRLVILNATTGERIPWVTLSARLDHDILQRVRASDGSAVEAIRRLGGDVGRCRNQRFTAANESVPPMDSRRVIPSPPAPAAATPKARAVVLPSAIVPIASPSPIPTSPYVARGAELTLGEPTRDVERTTRTIPQPPAHFTGSSIGLSSATPSSKNVHGEFSTVARKFAAYSGESSAPFVPFKAYYSTYADMSTQQLRFYFKWRSAARRGEAIPTDLSYIFVHAYELLHQAGAEHPLDAVQQLERLWTLYRGTYPNTDSYLVPWITDLCAAEIGTATALDFVRRAVALGAPAADELLLVTDELWAAGDYEGMPPAGIALLLGERRLGDNKFLREHNTVTDGRPWVEGAYREAMAATDRAFQTKHGRTLREATVEEHGLRPIAREAFQGAVYDWKRKRVVLGKVPAFTETARTVVLYRNVVRYAENLLRKERAFAGKLRGIEVDPVLAKALDTQIAAYIRRTKPKARVTIDLAKAKDLARESADVRARLLDGVEDDSVQVAPIAPAIDGNGAHPSPHSVPVGAEPDAEHLAAGLLSDLAAVQRAVASLSAPARALLEALRASAWEASENAEPLESAVGGVLVAPLADEINSRAVDEIGDVLIVHEGDMLIVQEDYRDEVYWVLTGSLDGFALADGSLESPALGAGLPASMDRALPVAGPAGAESFGPVELHALALIAGGGEVSAALGDLAIASASTALLLIDRVNECGLSSSYGDIVVDGDSSPPAVLEEAKPFVDALIARLPSSL